MGDSIVRVGVYARISEDRDGQQTATARQMQDAREFAVRKGWEIVDTSRMWTSPPTTLA